MHNFSTAEVKLGKRDSRVIARNTKLQRRDADTLAVKLHNTDVVTFHKDGRITLNSGGWLTPTTKDRINLVTNARIHQAKSLWYLRDGSLYSDGANITEDGYPTKPVTPENAEKEMREKKKRIKKYVDQFCDHIKAGSLGFPSGGDCWYCHMFEPAGQGSDDHLRNHMYDDHYFVPSLLFNAIKDKGHKDASFIYQLIHADGQRGKVFWMTRKILRDYLMKRNV